MFKLLASLKKESLLLLRDWHALLVLFVMPSVFVLVMSLALQGQFSPHSEQRLTGYLSNLSDDENASELVLRLMGSELLNLTMTETMPKLSTADRLFHIQLRADFGERLKEELVTAAGIDVYFAPELPARDRTLISAAVQQQFARFNTYLIATELGFDPIEASQQWLKEGFINDVASVGITRPNAVQQSVPAWLIFAMFFIAIPISTTLIQERQQKTLVRLKTFGVSNALIISAKLIPYLLINQLQLALLLAMGVWLLPRLGAEALSLNVSLTALGLISLAVSVAALGWAIFIATMARTVEQATVISGTLNILFAALGGIMIPRFVMPPMMQDIAMISPMAWALEGFQSVLVRQGTIHDILPSVFALVAMGSVLFALAMMLGKRRKFYD